MQLLALAQGSTLSRRLTASLVAGAALVLPFAALEWYNGGFAGGVPFVLFGTLWILAGAVLLLVWPLVRDFRMEASDARGPLGTLSRHWPALSIALLLATLWAGIVADQMPCFLGVPNCD